jgi:hypothetical protein
MFGNFLFLPDVKRACWTCLNVSHGTGVATLDDLAKFYSKSKTELRQLLPVLHPVPGVYTMRQLRRTGRRVELVSTNAALALALSRRGVLKSKNTTLTGSAPTTTRTRTRTGSRPWCRPHSPTPTEPRAKSTMV